MNNINAIPLPFPKCPRCNEESPKSVHRHCGGNLVVEILSDRVFCEACGHNWSIWDSKYYCKCGHVFETYEVADVLEETLEICNRCAAYILDTQKAKKDGDEKANGSLRTFATIVSYCTRDGMSCGVG